MELLPCLFNCYKCHTKIDVEFLFCITRPASMKNKYWGKLIYWALWLNYRYRLFLYVTGTILSIKQSSVALGIKMEFLSAGDAVTLYWLKRFPEIYIYNFYSVWNNETLNEYSSFFVLLQCIILAFVKREYV